MQYTVKLIFVIIVYIWTRYLYDIKTFSESVRQTDILSDSDDVEEDSSGKSSSVKEDDKTNDDISSVTSSTGSSHIAGKWWFGKSTRLEITVFYHFHFLFPAKLHNWWRDFFYFN